MYSAN